MNVTRATVPCRKNGKQKNRPYASSSGGWELGFPPVPGKPGTGTRRLSPCPKSGSGRGVKSRNSENFLEKSENFLEKKENRRFQNYKPSVFLLVSR